MEDMEDREDMEDMDMDDMDMDMEDMEDVEDMEDTSLTEDKCPVPISKSRCPWSCVLCLDMVCPVPRSSILCQR